MEKPDDKSNADGKKEEVVVIEKKEETGGELSGKPADKGLYKLKIGSEEIEMPYDKAQKVIAQLDTRTKGYNQMKADFEVAQKAVEDLKRQNGALAAAQKGEIEKAEEMFTSKVNSRLNMLKSALIDNSLKATLGSMSDVLPEAHDDIVKGFKLETGLDVEEATSNVTTKDGKGVKEALEEYVNKKPYFKTAQKSVGATGTVRATAGGRPGKTAAEIDRDYRDGMGDFLNKISKKGPL